MQCTSSPTLFYLYFIHLYIHIYTYGLLIKMDMEMRSPAGSLFFFLLLLQFLLIALPIIECSSSSTEAHEKGGRYSSDRRLVVFGDSYADTGNLPRIIARSWNEPYGMTFPKKPTGRFSDGRVFTDFFASFLRIRSPIPYRFRKYGEKLFRYGMNFAVGGSGVFQTLFITTNLTTQIDQMKEQVELGTINLKSSVALVVVAGNDYLYYQYEGGSMEGLRKFSTKLIHQLKLDLKRLHDLGVEKVAVTNLDPIGCLPSFTRKSSHRICNETANNAVIYHNKLLTEAVKELNKEDKHHPSVFVVINLFDGFSSSLRQGRKKYRNILKPCCEAVSSDYSCGYVDWNGEKKYSLCSNPEKALYWDSEHPTQAAWNSVYAFLKPSLNKMFN